MSPSPPKILPMELQVKDLKAIFSKLNPNIDLQLIDWNIIGRGPLDPTAPFNENLQNMEAEYPQYRWFETDKERSETKEEAIKEYQEYLDYLLYSAVIPEASEDMRPIFEKALSDYRYRTERNLERATSRKTIKKLEEQLLEAKRMGRPQKDIIEKERRKIEAPEPRLPTWTTRLEKKLEDVFKAAFTRQELSPTKYMSEYRLELEEIIKFLPTEDEMIRAVEAFADEIITRAQARKIRPPIIIEERPPERIYRPRPEFREEREEEWGAPGVAPTYPPSSMSEMPFPRNPAGIELDMIQDRFLYDLMNCGIYRPENFLPQFEKNFATVLFKSWDDMRNGYDLLIEQLCKGIEARYPYELRALPYESIEDGVYWLVSQKQFQSAEEIAAHLHELGTPTTAEEVRRFIRKGYENKVPNFVIVTRDYLEKLLGEPLY